MCLISDNDPELQSLPSRRRKPVLAAIQDLKQKVRSLTSQ